LDTTNAVHPLAAVPGVRKPSSVAKVTVEFPLRATGMRATTSANMEVIIWISASLKLITFLGAAGSQTTTAGTAMGSHPAKALVATRLATAIGPFLEGAIVPLILTRHGVDMLVVATVHSTITKETGRVIIGSKNVFGTVWSPQRGQREKLAAVPLTNKPSSAMEAFLDTRQNLATKLMGTSIQMWLPMDMESPSARPLTNLLASALTRNLATTTRRPTIGTATRGLLFPRVASAQSTRTPVGRAMAISHPIPRL